MSPLAIRRSIRPLRRRSAVLVAVAVIGGLLAVHHSGLDPISDGDMHAMTTAAMELCLPVLPLAAAVAVAGFFANPGWQPFQSLASRVVMPGLAADRERRQSGRAVPLRASTLSRAAAP